MSSSRNRIAGRVLLGWLLVATCASASADDLEPASEGSEGFTQTGILSYYGEKFHGRRTASGELFDRNAFTAAHRSLPFHTWVKVTNLENGRSVIVRINDRGPFVADRIADLSPAAAQELGMVGRGLALGQLSLP